MDTSQPSWFQMASRRMEWLSGRQQVIAQNIANADTPGYAGQDVQPFEDFLNSAPDGTRGPELADLTARWGANKNGNAVVLEEQTLLAAQSSGEFRLASRLYAKGHQLIALAAGRR
jgi:flagellar basal-body rod protein FlgB